MTPFTASLILLLLLIVFSAAAGFFPNCNQTFSCGDLEDITYPFTGGNRPSSCGPPEFRLSCRNDLPELTISSLSYRVVQIDQDLETLTLARLDLWNNTCPNQFINSSFDSSAFSSVLGNDDLTMFYGCSFRMPITPYNQFYCNVGANSSDSYYLIGPIPSDPILKFMECNVSIRVLILKSSVISPMNNLSVVEDALMKGFNLSFSDPYGNKCTECSEFGGQCGFGDNLGEPICICDDQLCIPTGSGSVQGSRNQQATLQIGIAASVAAIILIFVLIICTCRRKWLSGWEKLFRKKETNEHQGVEEFLRNCGSLAPKRYKYSEIKKMTNGFMNNVGQGGFGAVYKGKLSDGRLVAVKVLKESKSNGEEFMNEVASISRTSHVNVVTLLGFCYERSRRALIYEFMSNGSLDKFIYDDGSLRTNPSLEWKVLYRISVGIARGLEYLHQGCNTRIVHFDIKPHNILLDEDFCPKISDFGLAKLCKRKESLVSMLGARGTIGYIAPEVFCRNFGGVSHKSDVYSFGMMVLEMVAGRKNIDVGVSKTSEIYFPHWIYKDIESVVDLRLPGITTPEDDETARKMILVSLWCIQTSPSDRPSMTKVVEMLEGSLQSVTIPPKPILSSPPRSPRHSSTT